MRLLLNLKIKACILILCSFAPLASWATMAVPDLNTDSAPGLRVEVGVFGKRDPRQPAYDLPIFSAIHRIITGYGGICTAFLVDRSYALTAAHCLRGRTPDHIEYEFSDFWKTEDRIAKSWWPALYSHGQLKDSLARTYNRADFAVLRLTSKANQALAILEVASPEEVRIGMDAMSVGYPNFTYSGRTRVKAGGCKIRSLELEDDIIRTDCAMSQGNSGGPLLVLTAQGKWKVAGIASTQFMYPIEQGGRMIVGEPYSDEKANYFTNITGYMDQIKKVMRDLR